MSETKQSSGWRAAAVAAALLIAACDGPATSVRLVVSGDPALEVDSLAVAADGGERHAVDDRDQIVVLVPNSWAGTPHRFTVEAMRGPAVVAQGEVDATPVAGDEVVALVTVVDVTCPSVCTLDASRCVGDAVETCELGPDGCPRWSDPEDCPSEAPFCSDGTCAATCHDECTAGETSCDGTGGERACDDVDADPCLDWGPTDPCASDELCVGTACAPAPQLTVGTTGTGSGTVSSVPAGIDCGADCTELYPSGTDVTLTATPELGDTFTGWSGGGCTGTGDCVVTMTASVTVTASFAGVCTETCTPIAVATGLGTPSKLTVDATHVYWTDPTNDTVSRRAKAGGTVDVLASGQDGAFGIAVDATRVYWTTQVAYYARRVVKTGGFVESLGAGDGPGVVTDDTAAYWTYGGEVRRFTKATAAVDVVVTGQSTPGLMALDATYVYWTNGDGTIKRWPKAGGPVATVASGEVQPWGVAVDDTHVYWTTNGSGTSSVKRRAKSGGPVETIATDAQASGSNTVVVDATHVYWTTSVGNTVMRRSKSGGPFETLATGQTGANGLALDADHVYWTAYTAGTVMSLSRCACGL